MNLVHWKVPQLRLGLFINFYFNTESLFLHSSASWRPTSYIVHQLTHSGGCGVGPLACVSDSARHCLVHTQFLPLQKPPVKCIAMQAGMQIAFWPKQGMQVGVSHVFNGAIVSSSAPAAATATATATTVVNPF